MDIHKSIVVERFSTESWLPPWTVKEHQARYSFAAKFVPEKVVIDCACGSGESSAIFSRSGAVRVVGIDVAPQAVDGARSRYQLPGLEFHLGNGRDIPAGDSTSDIFICLETIEHVEEDARFVEEIWRVLRPGGLLICNRRLRPIEFRVAA